jgi:hypothetical protein
MWFRRWRRRRQLPPPIVLPPLERLAELIERVVVLLDQGPAPVAEQAVEARLQPDAEGYVLFVPSPAGYRLLERDGAAPASADVVEIDGNPYRILRVGRSPLPGDQRRCAFLEQEPLGSDRTSDG